MTLIAHSFSSVVSERLVPPMSTPHNAIGHEKPIAAATVTASCRWRSNVYCRLNFAHGDAESRTRQWSSAQDEDAKQSARTETETDLQHDHFNRFILRAGVHRHQRLRDGLSTTEQMLVTFRFVNAAIDQGATFGTTALQLCPQLS